ncbi:hypothetical protein [Pedobacter sp. NJ-S-72]
MKKINILLISVLALVLLNAGCKKLDRLPETSFTDDQFWNTENDLKCGK